MSNKDTIISIATPMGTGAISIIRCSGSNINQIMQFFFKKELTPRLANYANFLGWHICKHTHGELGLTAAMGQHLMLSIPNTCDGNQQTAQNMESDILEEEIPIVNSNSWGVISDAGLGVTVDKEKLNFFHKKFLTNGEYKLYGDKFPIS